MQYRPLKFFWIVEFSDGTAIAQFNPETGEEVQAHPDWLPSKISDDGTTIKDGRKVPYRQAYPIPEHFRDKRVVRIGWYPFNLTLARNIFAATEKLVVPSEIDPIIIDLKDGEEPICYRSHSIKLKMRSSAVEYAETIYVLGIKGQKIIHINENGAIFN